MADREAPYDPYIPQGGAASASAGREGNQRTAALQAVGELTTLWLFAMISRHVRRLDWTHGLWCGRSRIYKHYWAMRLLAVPAAGFGNNSHTEAVEESPQG